MALWSMFDNMVAAWTGYTMGINEVSGIEFVPQVDSALSYLRWYRPSTGANRGPTAMALYRVGDQSKVADASSITDSGAVGWQDCPISTPFTLSRGVRYRVAALKPSGNTIAVSGTGNQPVAPLQALWGATARVIKASAAMAYPDSADNYQLEAFDVRCDDANAAPPGLLTPGNLNSSLGDSAVVVGIQNDLAFIKASVLTDLAADVGTVQATVSDTAGDVSDILTSVGAGLGAAVSSLTTSIGTGLSTKVDDIKTSVGTGLNTALTSLKSGWEAWRGVTAWTWDTFQAVAALEGDWLNAAGQFSGKGWVTTVGKIYDWLGALGRETVVPGSGWAQVASLNFNDELAWNQPADLYLLSFSSPPSNAVGNSVAGVDWLGHMCWWAEWDGYQAGERHFLDFPAGFVALPGRRMAGVILRTNGVSTGTLTAWNYTAP